MPRTGLTYIHMIHGLQQVRLVQYYVTFFRIKPFTTFSTNTRWRPSSARLMMGQRRARWTSVERPQD